MFSTRDLVLGASFIAFNTLVGFVIAALQSVAETPYPVAMFVFGLVVIVGTLAASWTQIRLDRSRHAS